MTAVQKTPSGSHSVKDSNRKLGAGRQGGTEGLTPTIKGVTLWVPRGGQGAKKTEAARKIGQIEIPLAVTLTEETGDGLCQR